MGRCVVRHSDALDEREHFLHNRGASVAALRELFAFGPEYRSRSLRNQCSSSPESSDWSAGRAPAHYATNTVQMQKAPDQFPGRGFFLIRATSYSPTHLRVQYHRG